MTRGYHLGTKWSIFCTQENFPHYSFTILLYHSCQRLSFLGQRSVALESQISLPKICKTRILQLHKKRLTHAFRFKPCRYCVVSNQFQISGNNFSFDLQKADWSDRTQSFKNYRAPKISIRYTKKRAPKINSDVCFTKLL